MECFSTAGLPAARRLSFWNEVSSQTFTDLEVQARDPASFEGRLFRQGLGPVGLADVTTSAGRLLHTPAHVASGRGQRYTLLVALEGGFELRRDRRVRHDVAPGDVVLLDHACPYELHFGARSRTFCLSAGERWMGGVLPRPDRLAGRVVRDQRPGARLFVGFARSLSGELAGGEAGRLSPLLADGLRGLLGAAYADDANARAGDSRELRRRQVLAWMQERLDDPSLRPGRIAAELRIPERTLRWLFADQEEGLMVWLQRRRLERCSALLADRAWADVPVTVIALANGFNNVTHFGAVFRRRYGMSPGAWRRQAKELAR
jgi:AraC-like DNA-binding protein